MSMYRTFVNLLLENNFRNSHSETICNVQLRPLDRVLAWTCKNRSEDDLILVYL